MVGRRPAPRRHPGVGAVGVARRHGDRSRARRRRHHGHARPRHRGRRRRARHDRRRRGGRPHRRGERARPVVATAHPGGHHGRPGGAGVAPARSGRPRRHRRPRARGHLHLAGTPGARAAAGAGHRAVDARDAAPLSRGRHAARRHGRGDRRAHPLDRLSPGRDRRPSAARQRRRRGDQRGEPPRRPPRPRAGDHARRRASRPRTDEAPPRQRRAHLALPARRVVLRPLRRARPVRRRRGRHRVARPVARHQRRPLATPRRSSSAAHGWSIAIGHTPASSPGRSATSPATGRPTTRWRRGSAVSTRRGRSTTRAGSAAISTPPARCRTSSARCTRRSNASCSGRARVATGAGR